MKSRIELEQTIIKITSTIREKYPELSKFIIEMPKNNSSNETVNLINLEEYYNSLKELLEYYALSHSGT